MQGLWIGGIAGSSRACRIRALPALGTGSSLEPGLPPPWKNPAGTEPSPVAEAAAAGDALQDDGRRLEPLHQAGPLIDEFGDGVADAEYLAAVGHHFHVKRHAAVHVLRADRCQDLVQ